MIGNLDEGLRRRLNRARIVAYLLLLAAFVGQLLARKWFKSAPAGERSLPALSFFAALLVFIFACALYARVKGRSAWFGLLGILNVVGYLFITFMKKACHRCSTLVSDGADECPRCGAPI